MSTRWMRWMAVAVAMMLLAGFGSARAEAIAISNHSFQSPVLAINQSGSVIHDWTYSGASLFSYAGSPNFGWGLDPRPDGTSQNAHTGNAGNYYLYQVLGANVQLNTTYTLIVDVGDRSDTAFPATLIRVGIGNTYATNLLPHAGETAPTPNGGWQEWTAAFNSGPKPAGGALRVELLSFGGGQAHFDNVRLAEAATAPVSTDVTRDVFVFNHSFERNGVISTHLVALPHGWLSTVTLHQDGLIGGTWSGDPRPDGSVVNAFLKDNNIYQLTAETITAGTTYTLTVDVAARLGFPDGTAIRLGAGDTFGEDLLTMENIVNPSPTPDTAWELWSATATVADGDPLIGEPLRIELYNPGGQQPQFDNVRLTAFTVTPPAKGTLIMIR